MGVQGRHERPENLRWAPMGLGHTVGSSQKAVAMLDQQWCQHSPRGGGIAAHPGSQSSGLVWLGRALFLSHVWYVSH